MMDTDWGQFLAGHPLLDNAGTVNDGNGKRTMVARDNELVVAVGSQLRVANLDARRKKASKTLNTPEISFEISQLALNSTGKLLAVAGTSQVAVVVFPRSRLGIDCKCIPVGQPTSTIPIAKVDWHPWGENGSTLLVMTVDGKLKEYDISSSPTNPTQTLNLFDSQRKNRNRTSYRFEERDVASFCFGQGTADWGPLTIYALMKSGDVYAICPYLPVNASVPQAYIPSLETFIHSKQQFLSQGTSTAAQSLSTLYDYQRKFVNGLVKQLPPSTLSASTRSGDQSVPVHLPSTIKALPSIQGPFLLQPSPRILDGSEGGDATDVVYLSLPTSSPQDDDASQNIGIVLITYQDGKVDVCVDVEKVEARWDVSGSRSKDLPMLANYEAIDLGLISLLRTNPTSLPHPGIDDDDEPSLLDRNVPLIHLDPLQNDTVYVSHAFGVHSVYLRPLLRTLGNAMDKEDDAEALFVQGDSGSCQVKAVLSTWSVGQPTLNPVVGLTIPSDIYNTYSLFILTSTMRITCIPLSLAPPLPPSSSSPKTKLLSAPNNSLHDSTSSSASKGGGQKRKNKYLTPHPSFAGKDLPYISLLSSTPYSPPLTSITQPRLSLPPPAQKPDQGFLFVLTPAVLRYFATVSSSLRQQIHSITLEHKNALSRAALQKEELARQAETCGTLLALLSSLAVARRQAREERKMRLLENQKRILVKMEGAVRALTSEISERRDKGERLSAEERTWFEEAEKMGLEVWGASGRSRTRARGDRGREWDEEGLVGRVRVIQRSLNEVVPKLEARAQEKQMLRDERPLLQSVNGRTSLNGSLRGSLNGRSSLNGSVNGGRGKMGVSQAFEYGERAQYERTKISALQRDLMKLAEKVDIGLERPPTS